LADIFREIDEDLRRDRHVELWKRYGNYIIALALAIVVGTAVSVYWRDYKIGQREADSAAFAEARGLVQDERPDEATAAFAILEDEAVGGYALLASFQEAALLAEAGDEAGALAAYDAIAADSSADDLYRDLAKLLSVMRRIDDGDPASLAADLAPLAVDGEPWRFSARELQALLALRTGDSAKAADLLSGLADAAGAPPALRARAIELLAILEG
jgi:hypothetical protein